MKFTDFAASYSCNSERRPRTKTDTGQRVYARFCIPKICDNFYEDIRIIGQSRDLARSKDYF